MNAKLRLALSLILSTVILVAGAWLASAVS